MEKTQLERGREHLLKMPTPYTDQQTQELPSLRSLRESRTHWLRLGSALWHYSYFHPSTGAGHVIEDQKCGYFRY